MQITDDVDVQHLQTGVDALCHWAETWQLSVAVNKCCVLNVGKVLHITNICINGYLPIVETACDLGVLDVLF